MSIKGAFAGTHPGTPSIEKLNLTVNGSTPTIVSVTPANFTFITRIIWKLPHSSSPV